MTDYDQMIGRDDASGWANTPEPIVSEIIGGIQRESIALNLARPIPMSTREGLVPVLTDLPEAYWVSDPNGLKKTTKGTFNNKPLVAEEIATIVPVPQNVIDDAGYPLWDALAPEVSKACAKTLDNAVVFGVNRPASWGPSLLEAAEAAGTVIDFPLNPSTGIDQADNVYALLQGASLVAKVGYNVSGACVRPGFQWDAASTRANALVANPVGGDQFPLSIAGLPLHPNPVVWDQTFLGLVADFSNVLLGVRKAMKVETFDTGVITDETGAIKYNLLQQDMVAIRVTMRYAYLLAAPPTDYDLPDGVTSAVPVAFVNDYVAPAPGGGGDSVRRGPVAPAAKPPASKRR